MSSDRPAGIEEWKQERPTWCPHTNCQFLMRTQDSACCGRLPDPVPHDGDVNTHRLCLRGAKDDGEWLHDMQVNRSDCWHLQRVLKSIMGDNAALQGASHARPT